MDERRARTSVLSDRPRRLLAAYLLNQKHSASNVREILLEDIRRFAELGAVDLVIDLTAALHLYDAAMPPHPMP